MEAIRAADAERVSALFDVQKHITKYERAVQKFQLLEQTEEPEPTELVEYTSVPQEDLVQTRSLSGGRSRLATVKVDCEKCDAEKLLFKVVRKTSSRRQGEGFGASTATL